MGYQIRYGNVKKARNLERRTSRVCALSGVFFLLFLIAVFNLWPKGREMILRTFLPCDLSAASAAVSELTDKIQNGVALSEAVDCFVQDITEDILLDSGG